MCLYVRELNRQESQLISSWLRQSKSVVKMRRAQVIAFSGQGLRVQEIAGQLGMHEEYIRELIRRFNDEGFEALMPRKRTGRQPALTEEEESVVVEIATMPPQACGRPFNQWSLRKLHQYLVDNKMITPVSFGTIRNVLRRRGVTFQRTRTWKTSNDPQLELKKNGSKSSTARRRKAAR